MRPAPRPHRAPHLSPAPHLSHLPHLPHLLACASLLLLCQSAGASSDPLTAALLGHSTESYDTTVTESASGIPEPVPVSQSDGQEGREGAERAAHHHRAAHNATAPERRLSSRGWSTWSDWSTCSRTCDGGASYQLRRCKSASGCKGESVRYKICNMQPCPNAVDFRAQQCAAWDREPRSQDGLTYKWTPHLDESRPCALVCKGVPRHSPSSRRRRARGRGRGRGRGQARVKRDDQAEDEDEDDSGEDDVVEESEDVDEEDDEEEEIEEEEVPIGQEHGKYVVEMLAPRAQDGTRCRSGSLDMCINGKCQHVGCDLRIGSRRTVDACGVCGGDGSSCATPLYNWESVPSSLCSEACGGGYRSASHVCRNRVTGHEVAEALCDPSRRPEGEVEPCNTHRCPAKWIAEAWELCSVTCGGGTRRRDVYCAEVINGNLTKVTEDLCFGSGMPRQEEPCAMERCPTWETGDWGECSSSCGPGIQTRPLSCVDTSGTTLEDVACDPLRQPPLTRTCAAPAPAPCPIPTHDFNSLGSGEEDEDGDLDLDSDLDYSNPLLHPYPPIAMPMPALAERLVGSAGVGDTDSDRAFVPGPWGPCSATCGDGVQLREVHCRVYLEGTKARARIADKECPGPRPADKQPCSGPPCTSPAIPTRRFVVGDWSPCSVTCGEGTQRREVHCRLFLELSHSTTTLKAHQCPGPRPSDSRPCSVPLCPLSNTLDSRQDQLLADTAESPRLKVGGRKGNFSWKEMGFGECSKSCLGGVQDSISTCVRDDDGRVVSPFMCPPETQPERRTQTCNDHPCPARWNVTDFSKCSQECGMGIKVREVTCVHEVTNFNIAVVPPSRCTPPRPPERAYCNVLDCPPSWNHTEWSKCSRSCGGGFKTRRVSCEQRMAQNHIVARPSSMCPASEKPAERRPCNSKPCGPEDLHPHIAANEDTVVTEAKPNQKELSVKVGGTVQIYLGSKLKIRCPVKRFNRTRIIWQKDDKTLSSSKKYRIAPKGVMRIADANLQDTGRYTCVAGRSQAHLMVVVKSRPGEFISSEEIGGGQPPQQHPRHSERQGGDTGRVFPGAGDDISHEVPPTGTSRYNRKKTTPPPERTLGPQQRPAWGDHDEQGLPRTPSWHNPTDPSSYNEIDTDEDNELDPEATPAASSAARALHWMHWLHWLLVEIQAMATLLFRETLGASRGQRSSFPEQSSPAPGPPGPVRVSESTLGGFLGAPVREAPASGASGLLLLPGLLSNITSSEEVTIGPGIVLGRGSAAGLRFEWLITPWSECSETCGGNGFQLRAAQCTVRLHNATQSVAPALCEDAGGVQPVTFQRCGQEECPRWIAGEWSTCEDSRCFTWNTAMQRREVECRTPNDTVVEPIMCSESERPPQRLECYNDRCKGTWRVGEWSECAASCDGSGIKYRILQCVWYGTKKPAGNACRDQPRPPVMKPCKGPPCGPGGECRDQSQYCTTVRTMNLCRLQRYQHQCCQSCGSKVG